MSTTVFQGAMGHQYADPSRDWLHDRVFNGTDEFWEGASGSTLLGFDDDNGQPKSSLVITAREKYGFNLSYEAAVGQDKAFVLTYGKRGTETVSVDIGGNPVNLWKHTFVPKELAWEAIDYFVRTGERKEGLSWDPDKWPEQQDV